MKSSLASTWLVLLLLLGPAISFAQKRNPAPKQLPPAASKLSAIIVTGSDHFKPEDLLRATNMQIGQTVHDQDFKDAARILGDSGLFTDVAYTYEYSPEGTKLQWRLKEVSNFVPVLFENFVWFSDQALVDAIHALVPLFHGEIPARGRIADQISEVLQALLAQKGIPGTVEYLRVGPDDSAPEAFAYSVSGLDITIRNVDFSGASTEDLPRLKAAAEKLEGVKYQRSALRDEVGKDLLPVYLRSGHLKAHFSDPEAKVVHSEEHEILVDAIFVVDPGQQFKLTKLELTGNKEIPTETLQKLISVPLNQPIDAARLNNDIGTLKQFYDNHGYVTATVDSHPKIDDSDSTVQYTVKISEGEMYKMGELEIRGLDDRTTSRLQNEWTLRPGDPYDSSYPQRFLNKAYQEIGDWHVKVDESPNERDHTVDVTLRFESQR